MYQVVDRTGQTHGPVPVETLRNWASEGRLTPDMTVINTTNGQQGPAGTLLAGTNVFSNAPAAPQQAYAQPSAPQQQGFAQPQQNTFQQQVPQGTFAQPAQQFGFQGSDSANSIPKIGTRATAFLIDFLLGVGVMGAIGSWSDLLLWSYAHGWTGYLGYSVPFFVALYYLFRDAFFPGQSIGKRIARIKVINVYGQNCSMLQSVLRNISMAPLILLPIPYVGPYVIMPIVLIFGLVELFMVLTTGKRIMDGAAKTLVVNEA